MSIAMPSRTALPPQAHCFRDAESPPVHAGGLFLDRPIYGRWIWASQKEGRTRQKKNPATSDGGRRRVGDAVFSEDAAPS
jgi:hypothetical protein